MWEILNKLYANIMGYFWIPCPMCGEWFGGHQVGGSKMTSDTSGVCICKNCAKNSLLESNYRVINLGKNGVIILCGERGNLGKNKSINHKPKENKVDINYIDWLKNERNDVNLIDARKIRLFDGDKEIQVNQKLKEQFNNIGLSTITFITDEMYKDEYLLD